MEEIKLKGSTRKGGAVNLKFSDGNIDIHIDIPKSMKPHTINITGTEYTIEGHIERYIKKDDSHKN